MDILEKSLNLIDDIINDKEVKNLDFYENMLTMMSSLFNNSFMGIYFLENTDYILKAAIKNNILSKKDCKIPTEFIEKLLANDKKALKLQTKNNDYLFKNNILVKLAIRNSVFGFCILSKDSIVKDEETAFEALVNLLSYKIKDFELNEVFKIQVKAMQEAIIEKEGSYEVIKKQHKKLQELDKMKHLFLPVMNMQIKDICKNQKTF